MASRIQQDTFMDESDDCCPLCVEEFDLSDKNFRPCPCGYQVCQFCYNNIKNNVNGLCPACRRPYDEQSIQWKTITAEEAKADQALQARKKALARQKESERKNNETLSRKHLAGLRVVQKNLVYVVGLNPKSREQDLLQTLRGDQYFGQYGKIIKIVVSKAKEGANSNSIGVYVTFAKKEDAARCIAAVDGSQNGDRTLRAQFGTTKYCSAFLRNETCSNRSCMFLHETGEDDDSFSRQDLSSMNAVSTQRPSHPSSSKSTQPINQAPPQQAPQAVSAASHSMGRQGSRDDSMSRSDSGDGSALPSTASWATKNVQNDSKRSSNTASISAPSPIVTSSSIAPKAVPATQPTTQPAMQSAPVPTPLQEQPAVLPEESPSKTSKNELRSTPAPRDPSPRPSALAWEGVLRRVMEASFESSFDRSRFTEEQLREIDSHVPMIEDNRGSKRYHKAKKQREEQLRQEQERNALRTLSISEEEENLASGSLQLGGEPDTQDDQNVGSGRGSSEPRSAIQPPLSNSFLPGNSAFGSNFLGNHSSNLFASGRSFTPQHQQQTQPFRSGSNQHSPFNPQPQSTFTGNTSMHHHQQSNPFQNQSFGNIPGHGRQASRYAFANETISNTSAIKSSSTFQQSGILPSHQTKGFSSQPFQQSNVPNQPFYSGVQGPPPGLKTSGTPPVSGGGMFGQGHGFTSAMGGSLGLGSSNGASKDTNDEMMRELLRGRNGNVGGQGHDVGKREFKFPSIPSSTASNTAPASSLLNSLYGTQLGAYNGYQDHGLQKQKKKGKKHRHANTSSSGGGGLVNLADPSILQARMHYGGAGQGQFGVQGQGSRILPHLQKLDSIDTSSKTRSNDAIESSASKTPVKEPLTTQSPVPPGLSLPQDFPPLAAPSRPAPPARKPTQIAAPNIKPAVPVLPTSKPQASAKAREGRNDSTPERQSLGESWDKDPSDYSNIEVTKESTTLDEISGRAKFDNDKSSSSEATVRAIDVNPLSETPQKSTEKRPLPEKVAIAAAEDSSKKKPQSIATSTKLQGSMASAASSRHTNESTDSQADTPTKATPQPSTSVRSNKPQTRTLRVVPTSKTDNSVKTAAASPTVPESATTPSTKVLSRRPSLTSIQDLGTPLSEKASDNASFTSTSLSRANSPPPSGVGTAPIRQNTKNQQKKERRARAKQIEKSKADEEPVKAVVEDSVVQPPIIGRKKKAKKIAASRDTADSTPSVTRPSSPTPQEEAVEEKAPSQPPTPIKDPKKSSKREMPKAQLDDTATPETSVNPADTEAPKPTSATASNATALASTYLSLVMSGEIPPSIDGIFKNVPGQNYRPELTPGDLEEIAVPALTAEQKQVHEKGDAVPIGPKNQKPLVMMPDGEIMRFMTGEARERFLELRPRVIDTPQEYRWMPLRATDIEKFQLHRRTARAEPSASTVDERLDQMVSRFSDSTETQPSAQSYSTTAWPAPFIDEYKYGAAALSGLGPDAESGLASGDKGKGKEVDSSESLSQTLAGLEETLTRSKKETEAAEKKLNAVIKKNRKAVLGGGN